MNPESLPNDVMTMHYAVASSACDPKPWLAAAMIATALVIVGSVLGIPEVQNKKIRTVCIATAAVLAAVAVYLISQAMGCLPG